MFSISFNPSGAAGFSAPMSPTPMIFGPDLWQKWGISCEGDILPMPQFDWGAQDPFFKKPYYENYILLFIPERILTNQNVDLDLTLIAFETVASIPLLALDDAFEELCGHTPLSARWILVSKDVIPGTRGLGYSDQLRYITQHGFRAPHALEASIVLAMREDLDDGQSFSETYTRCLECHEGGNPIVVGGYGPNGLEIDDDDPDSISDNGQECGMFAVLTL